MMTNTPPSRLETAGLVDELEGDTDMMGGQEQVVGEDPNSNYGPDLGGTPGDAAGAMGDPGPA